MRVILRETSSHLRQGFCSTPNFYAIETGEAHCLHVDVQHLCSVPDKKVVSGQKPIGNKKKAGKLKKIWKEPCPLTS